VKESLAKINDSLVFRETLNDASSVIRNGGSITSVIFENGEGSFNGSSSKITYPTVRGVKSIRIILTPSSTTEDIVKLSSSHSISVSGGTISATGLSSPTVYVNGIATSTVTATRSEIVITTATAFNADDLQLGYISSYYNGDIDLVEIYNRALTASEVSNLYNQRYYKELPISLGRAELVTNGGFDSDTWWSKNAAWTISGGTANCDGTQASTTNLYRSGLLTVGRRYRLCFDITSISAGSLRISDGSVYLVTGLTIPKTYEYYWTPTADNFYITGDSDFIGSVDNVSVTELPPQTLCDFNTFNGTISERTGLTLTNTDVSTFKHGSYYSGLLNGGTSKIETGSDFINTKAFSVCFWMKPYSWGSGGTGRVLDNGRMAIHIIIGTEKIHLYSNAPAGTYYSSANNSIELNKWQFVGLIRKADGDATGYIGDLNTPPTISGAADQSSNTPIAGDSDVWLFNRPSDSARSFDGLIPYLSVKEGILSIEEITQVWSSTLKYIR
jgi:hypothetical protein